MNYVRWHAGASSAYRAAEGHLVSAVKYMKKWITERTAWMDKTYHTDTVIDD